MTDDGNPLPGGVVSFFDAEKGILEDVVVRYRVSGDGQEGYVVPDFTIGLNLVSMGMSVGGGRPLPRF